MYRKDYKFKSKDFFYVQRFPLYLSIPLFIAVSIMLLLFAAISLAMLYSPAGDTQIKSLIVFMSILYAEYLFFIVLFRARQAVGASGIFNRKKGLLPWDQIGDMHIGSDPCSGRDEAFVPTHQLGSGVGIATISNPTLHMNSLGSIGGMVLGGSTKLVILSRKIIFHVRDMDYKKNLMNLLKTDSFCGNLVF